MIFATTVSWLVANIKIWKSHLNIREGSDKVGSCRIEAVLLSELSGTRLGLCFFSKFWTGMFIHTCLEKDSRLSRKGVQSLTFSLKRPDLN